MIFEALNAGHGDCLLLHLPGTNGSRKLILVDGGPGSAGRQDGTNFRFFRGVCFRFVWHVHMGVSQGQQTHLEI